VIILTPEPAFVNPDRLAEIHRQLAFEIAAFGRALGMRGIEQNIQREGRFFPRILKPSFSIIQISQIYI
jgi:hypothetical protein